MSLNSLYPERGVICVKSFGIGGLLACIVDGWSFGGVCPDWEPVFSSRGKILGTTLCIRGETPLSVGGETEEEELLSPEWLPLEEEEAWSGKPLDVPFV